MPAMRLIRKAAVELLKELRALTADEHGAQRLAWSPTWLKAREWFQSKLSGLPVEHHYDAAGNSWTTLLALPTKLSFSAAIWTPCPMAAGLMGAWA
jgi:hypothetical protein